MAKKYRSERTGKHIQFSLPRKLTGTARYASVNAIRGAEQSRRDDLESAGYVLIYLAKKGDLPWRGLREYNRLERFKQIYLIKKNIKPEELCSNLPIEFCEYIKYVKKLKFEENPDYKYIKKLFLNALNKYGYNNDLNFSWLSNEETKYFSKNVKIQEKKKKQSLHARIIKNIEKNIENKNFSTKSKDSYIDNNENNKDINKIENISEISETQLAHLNASLNIEDDEIISHINDKKNNKIFTSSNSFSNIFKNSENALNKNIIKDCNKELYNINNSSGNQINLNNDDNAQSIPIVFDPINGSFKNITIRNTLKNYNNIINNINKVKINNNNINNKIII